MSKEQQLIKFFGEDEYGVAAIPPKFSNVRIARLLYGDESRCCSWCFPERCEPKRKECWKKYRKTQWRSKSSSY